MRKIFFKKDWKDIKNTFLENEEVILNDNYKGFKIELVYSPAVKTAFSFGDEVLLLITDELGSKYEYDITLTSDYEFVHENICSKFIEFETAYIENTAKTIEEVKAENERIFKEEKEAEVDEHLNKFNNYIATGDENLFADCLEYWEDKKNRADIIKKFLTNEVNKYAHSQLKIAFVLKTVYDEKLYQIDGYKNIYEYAYDNYNIARGTCSNWLKVVDNFGVLNKQTGFYVLDNKLQDFSITQLILIRGLTIEQIQAANITPDMPTREIKQVVKDELNLKHIATDVSVNTDNLIDNPDSENELYGDAVKADIISDSNNQSVGYDIKSSINPPILEKTDIDNSDKDVKKDSKETVREIEKPKMKLGLKGGFDLTTSQISMLNSLLNKCKGKEVDICIYVN
mgnify:CR=1 FL=1